MTVWNRIFLIFFFAKSFFYKKMQIYARPETNFANKHLNIKTEHLSQIFNSRGIIFKIFGEKTLIILKGSKS
jgi:hypothetical protein